MLGDGDPTLRLRRFEVSSKGNVIDWTALFIILILFTATLIRSVFGFGEALLAVPLLALVMPVEVAAPLAVLVSITIAFLILLRDWRLVQMREAGWLVLSTLFGIPLGLLLLRTASESVVKTILALIIIAFSAYSLTGRQTRQLTDDRFAWFFGFQAGVLGGAYGMNGPPLAIYGTLRRWPPVHFRATLQGYFLPASVAGMVGYSLAGLWTPTVNRFYLVSLPGVVIAIFLGRYLNRRMHAPQFISYVYVGLTAIGALLLLQAIVGWSKVLR
jgi:uncharacterized membrane protein YfcA